MYPLQYFATNTNEDVIQHTSYDAEQFVHSGGCVCP